MRGKRPNNPSALGQKEPAVPAENPQTNEERLLQREQAAPSMDPRYNGAEGRGVQVGVVVSVCVCAFDVQLAQDDTT